MTSLVFAAHIAVRVLTPLLVILPPVTRFVPVYKKSAIPLSCRSSRCGPLRQKCSILLLEPPHHAPFPFHVSRTVGFFSLKLCHLCIDFKGCTCSLWNSPGPVSQWEEGHLRDQGQQSWGLCWEVMRFLDQFTQVCFCLPFTVMFSFLRQPCPWEKT